MHSADENDRIHSTMNARLSPLFKKAPELAALFSVLESHRRDVIIAGSYAMKFHAEHVLGVEEQFKPNDVDFFLDGKISNGEFRSIKAMYKKLFGGEIHRELCLSPRWMRNFGSYHPSRIEDIIDCRITIDKGRPSESKLKIQLISLDFCTGEAPFWKFVVQDFDISIVKVAILNSYGCSLPLNEGVNNDIRKKKFSFQIKNKRGAKTWVRRMKKYIDRGYRPTVLTFGNDEGFALFISGCFSEQEEGTADVFSGFRAMWWSDWHPSVSSENWTETVQT